MNNLSTYLPLWIWYILSSMKKKIMLTGAPAVKKLKDGVDRVVDAVKLTLGPSGRNFASGVRGGAVRVSNDGVSLAREIEGRDEFEQVGVRAAQDAMGRANDIAGDGSSTTGVLMQSIFDTMVGDPETISAISPLSKFKQAKEEGAFVVEALNKMAVPVLDVDHLKRIVEVSVEDPALAAMIAEANWKVGKEGTLLAEESNQKEDTVEYINGVRIDNGYGSSELANNPAKMSLEISDVHVLVTDYTMNTIKKMEALTPVMKQLMAQGTRGVAIIARGWDVTAIGICKKNIEAGFNIWPLSAPYEDHDEVMQDLAAVTGAKLIKSNERNLDTIQLSDFGMSPKISATRYEGIVAGVTGDERVNGLVEARVARIRDMLTGQISPFEKKSLDRRLSQLTGGTALLKIGAETEQERKYRKDKVDDAINASKAALNDGVVPGAGQTLMKIASMLEDTVSKPLLADALRAPYLQIIANAGGVFEIPDWVEDPVMVVRVAFEKALSIAGSLATTEILVTHEDDKPMWVQQAKQQDEAEE